MQFRRPNPAEMAGDVVNRDVLAAIPPRLVAQHASEWGAVPPPPNPHARSVAHLFAHNAQGLIIPSRMIDQGFYSGRANILEGARNASAEHALSRFMLRLVQESGITPDMVRAGEDEHTPLASAIIDNQPSLLQQGAYAVLVPPETARGIIGAPIPAVAGTDAWYQNEEDGLYVRVQAPATVTPPLYDQLIVSTGSPDDADALVQGSIGMYPHLSLYALNTVASIPMPDYME